MQLQSVLRIFIVFTCAITLNSCAFHSGFINDSAALNSANFKYISHNAIGSAKTVKLFGLGGLSKQSLVNSAKQDLNKKFPLSDNQTYTNLSINFKRSYVIISMVNNCTITADIVEFKSENTPTQIDSIQ